jgi:hypothetical protein
MQCESGNFEIVVIATKPLLFCAVSVRLGLNGAIVIIRISLIINPSAISNMDGRGLA